MADVDTSAAGQVKPCGNGWHRRVPLWPIRSVPMWLVAAAMLVGLLARLPGVYWGWNFPGGWHGHHPDEYTHLVFAEMLIDPSSPPRWRPHPYPKGLAATVALPVLAGRALLGRLSEPPPSADKLVLLGRLVSVAFGTATILVVAAIAWQLFSDWRIGALAAWLVALGGLHVTQSHFFVSDVPSLFWLLLGLYLLLRELQRPTEGPGRFLPWAAFAFGVAFGTKLSIAALPSLAIVALGQRPRWARAAYCIVFFTAGFAIVNAFMFTATDLRDVLSRGIGDPYVVDRAMGALLYLIELPSVAGLPVLLLGLTGATLLLRKAVSERTRDQRKTAFVVVGLPLLVHAYVLLFQLDHFPRHLLPLLPWLSIAAAWLLVRLGDRVHERGLPSMLPAILVLAYMAVFVADGERVFIAEPRNRAAAWLEQNVSPGTEFFWNRHGNILDGRYKQVRFPEDGRPQVLIIERMDANHYLSGIGWRNSYPRDPRTVFDLVLRSEPADLTDAQRRLDDLQALFREASEYKEVATFSEGYWMPEYILTDRLIGDRSRSYVTGIVIFRAVPGGQTPAGSDDAPMAGAPARTH